MPLWLIFGARSSMRNKSRLLNTSSPGVLNFPAPVTDLEAATKKAVVNMNMKLFKEKFGATPAEIKDKK